MALLIDAEELSELQSKARWQALVALDADGKELGRAVFKSSFHQANHFCRFIGTFCSMPMNLQLRIDDLDGPPEGVTE